MRRSNCPSERGCSPASAYFTNVAWPFLTVIR
ncbi:Uncharacterised protein [Bordetella pertussis]|nr:Uncharacterised protein [Bordetella pertussis]